MYIYRLGILKMLNIQSFSYHTHTNFSDGRNTVLEMVRQAKKLGFCELGISDHLSIHKNMQKSLSYPLWKQRGNSHIFRDNFQNSLSEFQKHCEEIHKIAKNYSENLIAFPRFIL